jgi:tripeptide aminopeptidase
MTLDRGELSDWQDGGIKDAVLEKFLRYVKIDTQSDENSPDYPSTSRQFDLANLLVDELKEMGICDARVDPYCYVTATLPATAEKPAPAIGLIAHLDTSPEVSGKDVKPRIIERYRGGDIVLDSARDLAIREGENPELSLAQGHTIVTSDGSTLLGADDKAGIAAIMTAVEFLLKNDGAEHGTMKIAFTPDEEIGKGVQYFDVKRFGADFAYTVDGGFTGELNDETFSADCATVTFCGRDMHPGSAKDRMVNSLRALVDFVARLPIDMTPERTCGRQPFIHPHALTGSVGKSTVKLLLRDFADEGLCRQKTIIEEAIAETLRLFPETSSEVTVSPTYRNMRPALLECSAVFTRLELAATRAGLKPFWKPIRGGTDGAVLTARGLPTPNVFTASCNSHSLTEWLDVDGLVMAVETLINVCCL